jgi:hypothetical protein
VRDRRAVKKLEAEIGPPVTAQLEAIEARLKAANDELDTLKDALRNFDQIEAVKKRLAELDTQEKDLSQKIADCDRELCRIDSYVIADGDRIAEAIAGKFKFISWRLHTENLNGGIVPCCVAELNGVPYHDMSKGESIFAGIDAINVLSEYYNVRAPLFVDDAEKFTSPLEAQTQTIELRAERGVTELRVDLLGDGQRKAVA